MGNIKKSINNNEVEKMVDIKEIKSIELVPFTLMTSSIGAIVALIYAILLLIALAVAAVFVPTAGLALASLGLSLIVLYPITTFFFYVMTMFVTALFYNMLVPRLGGIKLGLEGDEVKNVPVVPFALIIAGVMAIWAFIIGLILAAIVVPFTTALSTLIPILSNITANATNITPATLPTGSVVGTGGVVLAILLIIGLPIFVFVAGFIGHALAAIFYNFIIPRVGGIRLMFTSAGTAPSNNIHTSSCCSTGPCISSLIFGIIEGIIGLINGIIAGSAGMAFGSLIGNIVGSFIGVFIMVAIIP